MWTFKCKHPADGLAVLKDATIVPDAEYPHDFNDVTYHLHCARCREQVDIKYAEMIGGANEFLKRDIKS